MFSGIIETQSRVKSAKNDRNLVLITVERPSDFSDLKLGDSIACNGVCLTVARFDQNEIEFALGAETLQVTGWSAESLRGVSLNLERSLRWGDRVHGHLVSGHVDAVGEVLAHRDLGGSTCFDVRLPGTIAAFVWKKGSWAVNGVSLTVNSVQDGIVSHVLIPETLSRTNLGALKEGDRVNLEADMYARGILRALEGEGKGL